MFQDTFQILGGVFFALEHICRIYFSVHKKTPPKVDSFY